MVVDTNEIQKLAKELAESAKKIRFDDIAKEAETLAAVADLIKALKGGPLHSEPSKTGIIYVQGSDLVVDVMDVKIQFELKDRNVIAALEEKYVREGLAWLRKLVEKAANEILAMKTKIETCLNMCLHDEDC